MSAFLTLSVSDTIGQDLRHKKAALEDPRGLMAAAGKRLEVELKAHFQRRNGQPNRQGWPKRNLWNQIRRATKLTSVSAGEAVVTVAAPELATKINGNPALTPKRGKYLAIPATQEAYAAGSPREGGLPLAPLIRFRDGRRTVVALVEPHMTNISFKRGRRGTTVQRGEEVGGRVQYWLKKQVRIPRDPDAIPAPAVLDAAIRAEVQAWLNRKMGGRS